MTLPEPERGDPPPSPDSSAPPTQWRPGDADRGQVAQRLHTAVDEGRLDLFEYDQRLRAAHAATTHAELTALVADLPPPAPQPEPVLVRAGGLTVTPSTVHTPSGALPLPGCSFVAEDHWSSRTRIAQWAIWLAVGLFLVMGPFSLLFLLARESYLDGTVDITISRGDQQHVVRVPVQDAEQVQHTHSQVHHLRSLAGGTPGAAT